MIIHKKFEIIMGKTLYFIPYIKNSDAQSKKPSHDKNDTPSTLP